MSSHDLSFSLPLPIRPSILLDQESTLMISFNLSYLPKSLCPNTVTLGLGAWDFSVRLWGDTMQSTEDDEEFDGSQVSGLGTSVNGVLFNDVKDARRRSMTGFHGNSNKFKLEQSECVPSMGHPVEMSTSSWMNGSGPSQADVGWRPKLKHREPIRLNPCK